MTPTAVQTFKVLSDTLEKIRFRDWEFRAGEIDGNVFFVVTLRRYDPDTRQAFNVESQPSFVGSGVSRLGIALSVLESVNALLLLEASGEFTWGGVAAFARTG